MGVSRVPVVSIVACLLPEYGIGYQGTLPWRLAREMKYFRQATTATFDPAKRNAVVMGRKTWESIPARWRPLPGRLNVVVSRTYTSPWARDESGHVITSNSLQLCVRQLQEQAHALGVECIYIMGGAEIYNQCYDLCDHMLVTELQAAAGSPAVPMDTFLARDVVTQLFARNAEGPRTLLPSSVELPEHPATALEEGGFQFRFALYDKVHRG
ncbi:AaceriACR124Wp [[Ashbya] aceris (nom. inval.)]|nr:AaceriACR124Wp [[Ashbya] aceris (nom. inval.)]